MVLSSCLEESNDDGDNDGGQKLCIEVDGPSHFYTNTRIMNSSTLMKHRHLKASGWFVISLPYWEWDKLKTIHEKRNYLITKMANYTQVFKH